MIQKQNNEIFSTAGKYVHIKNTDNYFKRGLAIGLSVEQCEEVDEIPQTTNTKAYEYDAYFAYCEQCKAEAKEWFKEHPNGDLPPLPQVEEVTDYLSETTDDVVGFGQ